MKKTSTLAATLGALLALTAAAPRALGWEAQTTQVGLAEQAALSSALQSRLVDLGFTDGLVEQLAIPPGEAPALYAALRELSATHGTVPDARGQQTVMAWLGAGAALADSTPAMAANHFFDVRTGHGFSAPGRGVGGWFADLLARSPNIPQHGMVAPDWVTAPSNPFGVDAFYDAYAKAITAPTPAQRARNLASALIAAGATLHVLGDLGVPARVRGDWAAQFDQLSDDPADRGSRLEHVAALAFGRLGVPSPTGPITRAHLRDYFTSSDHTGLADITAAAWFSPGTLPHDTWVAHQQIELSRPTPTVNGKLRMILATEPNGVELRSKEGVCLARYHIEHGVLSFWQDDACLLAESTVLLTQSATYETGLLDFLIRGKLTIQRDAGTFTSDRALGAGTLYVLSDAADGRRTEVSRTQLTGLAAGAATTVTLPEAPRVLVVFVGKDTGGERIVAAGSVVAPR